MQQIFPCPVCGAQNCVGQVHCQVCGQRFQYNCPYCGAVVDSTLVNCPGCRQSLFWPTPQRVKPFPKQAAASGGRGEGEEGEVKKKPKSDPWLTGCLGLVIIAVLLMVAYLLYDHFTSPNLTPTSNLLPASGNEIALKPTDFAEYSTGHVIGSAIHV